MNSPSTPKASSTKHSQHHLLTAGDLKGLAAAKAYSEKLKIKYKNGDTIEHSEDISVMAGPLKETE